MTSFSSGCVVPVEPRFEDPPAVENFPPVIMSSMLNPQGSTVTAVGTPPSFTFTVTATDPNAGDKLYARWLGEYPNYSSSSFILADQVPTPSLTLTTTCQDPYPRNQPMHKITLLVSDRPFWDPSNGKAPSDRATLLTTNVEGTQMAEANWVLNLTCSN